MEKEPRSGQSEFAGHRISYRVAGHGPVLVLVKPHRYPKYYPQLQLLSDRYTVIQIEPLGFGASDRPHDYPRCGLHEQILAVLDQETVDRFVIWGYSQGGAMAAAIAQATPRVAAMIAGGYSLLDRRTDAQMTRMDREQRVPLAPRTFWHWYRRFDWLDELAIMRCPRLIYFGADDHTWAPRIRHTREPLTDRGVTVIEFEGLDHNTCMDQLALSTQIVPAVVDWLDGTVGTSW